MIIYQHIDELPIYNFDRFLATRNDNWFIKGFDGRQPLVKIDSPEAEIMEQWHKLIDDKNFASKLQKWAKIDNLITKYKAVHTLISVIASGFDNTEIAQECRTKLIVELNKWRFKMPLINSEIGDIQYLNKVQNDLEGIKNQIAILKTELKDDGKKEQISLYKQLAIIQISLEIPPINPRKLVTAQFGEYIKLMQEKHKKNE